MHLNLNEFQYFPVYMGEPLLTMEERGAIINSQAEPESTQGISPPTAIGNISEGNEGNEGSERSERSSVNCMQSDGVVPFAPDADADVCLSLALTRSAAYAKVNDMLRLGLSASGQCVGRCWGGQLRGMHATGPYMP